MKTYSVVFHYSVQVVAEDEYTAEDMAWDMFGKADPTRSDDFACSVDEIESVFTASDCAFCHGEEWVDIDDLQTFDGLRHIEYHYTDTDTRCKGDACRRCIAYAATTNDIVITYLEEEK